MKIQTHASTNISIEVHMWPSVPDSEAVTDIDQQLLSRAVDPPLVQLRIMSGHK